MNAAGAWLLALLVVAAAVAAEAVEAGRARAHHSHNRHRRHRRHVDAAQLPQPPFFGAALPGLMPGLPAAAGLLPGAGLAPFVAPLPGAPAAALPEAFRFAQAQAQLGTQAGAGTEAAAAATATAGTAAAPEPKKTTEARLFNLLSKQNEEYQEQKGMLSQEDRRLKKDLQVQEARKKEFRQSRQMFEHFESCLMASDGDKNQTQSAAALAANATAMHILALEEAEQVKRQKAELERAKQAYELKERDIVAREARLEQRRQDLEKREEEVQRRDNELTRAFLANLTGANHPAAAPKVEVKYVKVPEIVYKPLPTGCEALSDCSTCAADSSCGWCESSKRCISTANGTTDLCDADSWSFNFCKHHECAKHVHCSSCLADPRCGLCADTGLCTEGELLGPAQGTCNAWNYATDLRFLSYNVYGRDLRNITGRATWLFKMIQQADADFIALQEVEDWFIELLAKERWALNYHMSDFGSGHAPGGLLILSKLPLESVSYYEKTDPGQVEVDQRARLLVAKPKMGSRNLVLAATTLDWRSAANRVAGLQFVFSVLNATSDAVLLGDFNFDAGAQPEAAHVPGTYHDVWSQVHPTLNGFTWDPTENSYARESDPTSKPSRIDRVLVKSGFWLASKIDKIGCPEASPHYGLLAEFSMFGAYC